MTPSAKQAVVKRDIVQRGKAPVKELAGPTGIGMLSTATRPASRASIDVGRRPRLRAERSEFAEEFVEVCAAAIEIAFGRRPDRCQLMPGVAVAAQLPMLLAYLLYLTAAAPQTSGHDVAGWVAQTDRAGWKLLGFSQPPSGLEVELAFSLLSERAHQAPELHGLIAMVEFLAGAELLHGAAR